MDSHEKKIVPHPDDHLGELVARLGDEELAKRVQSHIQGMSGGLVEWFGSAPEVSRGKAIQGMLDFQLGQMEGMAIQKRDFSRQVQRVMDMDTPGSFTHTKKWLESLHEKDEDGKVFLMVTACIPAGVMFEKLEMMDLAECGPERLASYLRYVCNRVQFVHLGLDDNGQRTRVSGSMETRIGIALTKMTDLLDEIDEREDDDELLEAVVAHLKDRRSGEVADYVVKALEQLVDSRNHETAGRMLEIIDGDGSLWAGEARGRNSARDDDEW